ncbi:ABC transporter permease [Rhizobium skierniewicense]|uniref:ABC transporter permease n=1 Tax=Rhizobium skierniewicense TaxID=984260 RepID=UPI001F4867F0|nr:ABC transporter permease [Rhizobium skierniewicense]
MILAVIQRVVQMLFVMIGISALVFLIFFATPGSDPAARLAGRNASPETVESIRKDFGFDRALPVQYVIMMKRLFVTQDLTSFVNRGMRVVPAVASAAPVTLSLVAGAAILWVIGGIFVGVVAALTRDTLLDRGLMALSLIGVSMPVYWLGEVMNLITQSRFHDTVFFLMGSSAGVQALDDGPYRLVQDAHHPLVHAGRPLHRHLWPRPAG